MAGTYPTTIEPRAAEFTWHAPTAITRCHSGRIQTRSRGGAWLEITLHYGPLALSDDVNTLLEFIQNVSLTDDRFNYTIPETVLPKVGPWAGAPGALDGNHLAGDNGLDLTGYSSSQLIFLAGDLISFSGGGAESKLYQVRDNAAADSGGDLTVITFPPLTTDVSSGATVPVDRTSKFRLTDPKIQYEIDTCGYREGLSVSFVEAPSL
jgi:hypothetical protein